MKQRVTNNSPRGHAPAPAPTRAHIHVLVACEESQAECRAFRALGFDAYSCDIQPCHGSHPEWHIHGDVTPLLHGVTQFTTQDGQVHHVDRWHLIVAHPPCTYICRASAVQLVHHGVVDPDRLAKMHEAVAFFYECLGATCDYLAVENPIPMKRAGLPRPDCYIEPSWFGVKYTKKTLYWLRNLPPIMADAEHPTPRCFVKASRGKYRSRTFPQVANALAYQWGLYVEDDLARQTR